MKTKTEAQESTEKLDIKRRKCTLSENIQKAGGGISQTAWP